MALSKDEEMGAFLEIVRPLMDLAPRVLLDRDLACPACGDELLVCHKEGDEGDRLVAELYFGQLMRSHSEAVH